jgi:hypothetical protein
MTNHITGVGDAKIVFLSSYQKIEPSQAASTQTGSIIAEACATNAMKNLCIRKRATSIAAVKKSHTTREACAEFATGKKLNRETRGAKVARELIIYPDAPEQILIMRKLTRLSATKLM